MTLSPVLRAVHVRRTPTDAFEIFTRRIGAWWPLLSHGLFGERSGGLAFAGDRLVERSLEGEEVLWGTVTAWEPGRRLALTWHPGRDDGPATAVEVVFTADDDGTRVELTHRGWDVFGADALAARRTYCGPNAWGWVLEHFADVADRQADGPETVTDTAALRAAYATFFAEALAGGFGPPPAGEWSHLQVVAHVAVNDDGIAAVSRGIVQRLETRFDNALPNDLATLDVLVKAHDGDLAALVATARQRAQEVVLLLERLGPEQLETRVPCRLVDHGEVVLDESMEWGRIAVTVQAGRHLPAHTDQLRSLRPG